MTGVVAKRQQGLPSVPLSANSNEKPDEAAEESASARLQRLVTEAKMPPEALKACERELRKLKSMEQGQQLGPEVCSLFVLPRSSAVRLAPARAPREGMWRAMHAGARWPEARRRGTRDAWPAVGSLVPR